MKELEVLESQKKHKEEVMFQDDKNEKISPEELWDRWKRSQGLFCIKVKNQKKQFSAKSTSVVDFCELRGFSIQNN